MLLRTHAKDAGVRPCFRCQLRKQQPHQYLPLKYWNLQQLQLQLHRQAPVCALLRTELCHSNPFYEHRNTLIGISFPKLRSVYYRQHYKGFCCTHSFTKALPFKIAPLSSCAIRSSSNLASSPGSIGELNLTSFNL